MVGSGGEGVGGAVGVLNNTLAWLFGHWERACLQGENGQLSGCYVITGLRGCCLHSEKESPNRG